LTARDRRREAAVLYGGLTIFAFWASFGPAGGFYTLLYSSVPAFSLMRAPSRFAVVVALGLSVLAGIAISRLLELHPRWRFLGFVLAVAAAAELKVPLQFPSVGRVEPGYQVLATLPMGPVLEIPVYSEKFAFARTRYMLSSTVHWMPLVDGYSSYTPGDFLANAEALSSFPSDDAFEILERDHVRYVVFHPNTFGPAARQELEQRLWTFRARLIRRYADDRMWLYEIVKSPA
jgi:hypothetical protein